METALKLIFFGSALVLLYAYGGYALLLGLFPGQRRKTSSDFLPPVTLVVPVFNEKKMLQQKIQNCLSLHYPAGALKFLFVDDGSTDGSATIIRACPEMKLLSHPERRGKTAALNTAMQAVQTDFVVFTDANALAAPDCLKKMMRHYAEERVGGVSGEKKIAAAEGPVPAAEKIYWQYESFLKQADSDFYSVVGADGGLFSIRTVLFQPLPEDVVLDDFFISAQVCRKGYQFVYEKEAIALETSSATIVEERKRKVRISAGCFQALSRFKDLLNPLPHCRLFLVYASHRVLRWTVCPLLLPLIFFAHAALAFTADDFFYIFSFVLHLGFYFLALTAAVFAGRTRNKLLLLPYYFVFMNLSLYQGLFRFLKKGQSVKWEKTERA